MKIHCILLVIFCAISCKQSSDFNYVENYLNGQTRVEANYTNGIKNGEYREYYKDGVLKYHSNFINGLQTDTTKYFNEHGILKYVQIWDTGIPKVLFENFPNEERRKISGTDDFFDRNLIIHNKITELTPDLELLDDSIRLDSLNLRVMIPNCARPHKVQLNKGKLKAIDHFGHILITDFNINQTTVSVSIMSNDGMLQLPEIPLSNIKK